MAAVTKHLGFGITFSTTYEPPFVDGSMVRARANAASAASSRPIAASATPYALTTSKSAVRRRS